MTALAQVLTRIDAAASLFLDGALPGSPLNPLLPEWEATLGLPDPCAGGSPTFDQRRDQVRARFSGTGGMNRRRFIDYAAALGFEITIANYAPFRAGSSPAGSTPVADDAAAFIWSVTIVSNPGGASSDVLMCELEALKPAETDIVLLS